jgi:signal transduction histidine kinase
VQHIEEVISDICDVVRPLQPHYNLTDMSEFLEYWCKAAVTEGRLVGIAVDCIIEEELLTMYIDPSLIRQALWHLLENSLDAMTETGGEISIKALLCWDNVLIELQDTGSGFSGLSIAEAAHPFTSTRPGKMGLGLSLCRQIVFDHGGDIEFFSKKDGVNVIIEILVKFEQPSKK